MMRPLTVFGLTLLLALAFSNPSGMHLAAEGRDPTWSPDAGFVPEPDIVAESVWFNQEQGELRPLDIQDDRRDANNRDSRWQATPQANATGWGAWNFAGQLWQVLGWLLLATFFATLVVILCYVFESSDFRFDTTFESASGAGIPQSARITRRRMAELPQELQHDDTDLRARAEEAMRNGEHERALIFLFGHQLLLLDAVGWLRLTRGKTNRQYVREARRGHANASSILAGTVNQFERSYFGKHAVSASEFEELWRANRELEASTQSVDHATSTPAMVAESPADSEGQKNAPERSPSDA
ncbi:MAG: DUF4129 domain-containing protein [Planctomycetota bacterium]